MPEHGCYEKVPRPESRESLINYLKGSQVIDGVEELSYQVINVIRDGKPAVKTFLTNIYVVSIADVYEIMGEHPDLNAIVTMSAWNGYSKEAKQDCKQRGVGLFTFKEFLGAVWYKGPRFLNYTPPERD